VPSGPMRFRGLTDSAGGGGGIWIRFKFLSPKYTLFIYLLMLLLLSRTGGIKMTVSSVVDQIPL
jgi:hypothetical protein